MTKPVEVSAAEFSEEVIEVNLPVLVDFWAPWCGYCTRMSQVIDMAAKELEDKVKIVKVNVDNNRTLAQKYGVQTLPTIVFFKDGEPGERIIGFMTKEAFVEKIVSLL